MEKFTQPLKARWLSAVLTFARPERKFKEISRLLEEFQTAVSFSIASDRFHQQLDAVDCPLAGGFYNGEPCGRCNQPKHKLKDS